VAFFRETNRESEGRLGFGMIEDRDEDGQFQIVPKCAVYSLNTGSGHDFVLQLLTTYTKMRRRDATKSDVSVRFTEDAVDGNGMSHLAQVLLAPVKEDLTKAVDVPVRLHPYTKLFIVLTSFFLQKTPPPKSPPSCPFGLTSNTSLTFLIPLRQGSASSLLRGNRPSELSQSNPSITDTSSLRSADDDSRITFNSSSSSTDSGKKSSLTNVFSRLRNKSSKPQLVVERNGSGSEHPSLRPPAPPPSDAYVSFLNVGTAPSTLSLASVASTQKWEKHDKKKKPSQGIEPRSPPPKDDEHRHMLDTDIDKMEGIVDFRKVGLPSAGESGTNGDLPSDPGPSSDPSLDFTNPFIPTSTTDKRKAIIPMDYHKVSPKTVILPGFNQIPNSSMPNLNGDGPGSPTWTPPESWAVEKEEGGTRMRRSRARMRLLLEAKGRDVP